MMYDNESTSNLESIEASFTNANDSVVNMNLTSALNNAEDPLQQLSRLTSENKNYQRDASRLKNDLEIYKQEHHVMSMKIKEQETLIKELMENNESLEEDLVKKDQEKKQQIIEARELFSAERIELNDQLIELKGELEQKTLTITQLQETVKTLELAQSSHNQSTNYSELCECLQSELETAKDQIEELKSQWQVAEEQNYEMNGNLEMMRNQCAEYREILQSTKDQLTETSEMLESAQRELAECKEQLNSKNMPSSSSSKGNSVFAEVEDRRQEQARLMTSLRDNCREAKKASEAKESIIRALKADKAALMRKWEDDTIEAIDQNQTLMETYKSRICELENNLQAERKKLKEERDEKIKDAQEVQFSYLQKLLSAKKKQVEDLQLVIENKSMKSMLEEESKHKMAKQIRYWRYKAMSLEAQIMAFKLQVETAPDDIKKTLLCTLEKEVTPKVAEINKTLSCEADECEQIIANETASLMMEGLTSTRRPMQLDGCLDLALSCARSDNRSNQSRLGAVGSGGDVVAKESAAASINVTVLQNNECCPINVSIGAQAKTRASSEESQQQSGNANKENKENVKITDDTKKVRFTEDTLDVERAQKPQKTDTPKYTALYFGSNKSKGET